MIWTKTEAGRAEMQTRALVANRAQRNLLLLIDGVKSEEMLLANVAGITRDDFKALAALSLIASVPGSSGHGRTAGAAPERAAELPFGAVPLDYATFTTALTQMISAELGLRGFTLSLAVEKAGSIEELREVAQRTLDAIRERKGLPAAEKARRQLFGA